MEFEVEKIPKSKTILIPVANENLKDIEFVTDISFISCGKRKFEVLEWYEQEKDEAYQRALFQLALGKDINQQSLFNAYPKSSKIFLFVCTELNTEKEIKNEEKEVKKEVEQEPKVEFTSPELDL
jgi:hypothetical protein